MIHYLNQVLRIQRYNVLLLGIHCICIIVVIELIDKKKELIVQYYT